MLQGIDTLTTLCQANSSINAMVVKMATNQALTDTMQAFADSLETRERPDGSIFACLKDSARGTWCQDIVHECHNGALPDDFKYSAIHRLAKELAGESPDDWEDAIPDIIENDVSIYNHDLIRWLASGPSRAEYVNDAVEISGMTSFDLFTEIRRGQFLEIEEIAEILIDVIDNMAED